MRLADRLASWLYRALAHELAISGPQEIGGQLVDAELAAIWVAGLLCDPAAICGARGRSGVIQLACHLPVHDDEIHYDRSTGQRWLGVTPIHPIRRHRIT